MNNKMCPLLLQAAYNAGFNPTSNSNLCIQENCAWWCGTEEKGECAIKKLAIKAFSVTR